LLRTYLFEAAGIILHRVAKWSALKAWVLGSLSGSVQRRPPLQSPVNWLAFCTACVAGGYIMEHQGAVLQMPPGQRRLDGRLAFVQPIERGVKLVFIASDASSIPPRSSPPLASSPPPRPRPHRAWERCSVSTKSLCRGATVVTPSARSRMSLLSLKPQDGNESLRLMSPFRRKEPRPCD
jgi:hypothetical protein